MFFQKEKFCQGSGKYPVKMSVAYCHNGKEITIAEYDLLFKQGKDKEVKTKLINDDQGDFTCPFCNGYMSSGDPMIQHSEDAEITLR